MPALASMPDDVWSHVVDWLVPPPPISMAESAPTLLDRTLRQFRPPKGSFSDLLNFSRVSKQFQALSEKSVYAYLKIRGGTSCGDLAGQLCSWDETGSAIPTLVVGLVVNDFASVSAGDLKALVEVLALLPNLRYLDLGGIPGLPTRSDTLLALLSVVPPLRSLVGFSIAPSNYRSAAATLSALATTLESLSIVEAEEMEPVLEVRRQPSVHLPALRYLEVVPPDSTITREKTVYESWTIPLLRTVFVGGQFQYAVMAEGYADTAIFAGKSSIEETTLLMDFAVSPEDYHSLEPFDNLRTLAIHICEDDLWASDPVNVGGGFTHPSVSTLILIQESTEILHEGTPESHRAVYPKIARLASKSTFPSLKKVYYVTENVDGHVWNLWSRIAVDLVKAGVDVVYL